MPQSLRDIMTANVITIKETQTVQEAAALMSQNNIGAIPVVNNSGQMAGIITDRDITLRNNSSRRKPTNTVYRKVTTAQTIVQGTPDMDVHQAGTLMAQQQFAAYLLWKTEQAAGMVALGDLAVQNQYAHEAEEALQSI